MFQSDPTLRFTNKSCRGRPFADSGDHEDIFLMKMLLIEIPLISFFNDQSSIVFPFFSIVIHTGSALVPSAFFIIFVIFPLSFSPLLPFSYRISSHLFSGLCHFNLFFSSLSSSFLISRSPLLVHLSEAALFRSFLFTLLVLFPHFSSVTVLSSFSFPFLSQPFTGPPCRSYSPETLSSMQNVCWVAPTLLHLISSYIVAPKQLLHRWSGSPNHLLSSQAETLSTPRSESMKKGRQSPVSLPKSLSAPLCHSNIAAHWRTVWRFTKDNSFFSV